MTKILVAYASKYGATKEIAQAIADVLDKSKCCEVEVLPAAAVGDVTPYAAVVLGSAIYAGSWREDVVRFLEDYQAQLQQRPVWIFSSGPTGEGDPVELLSGWRVPDKLVALIDRLMPRDVVVFHGSIDMDKLNLGEKLIVKAVRGKTGDYRDWVAIRAWALQIMKEIETIIAV